MSLKDKKGRDDICGIILVNKPQNWTSHDCVAVVRRKIGVRRVGHTGTLDPMATGVLPVCIGTAARITEYLDLDFKTYRCEMKFGITTDTEDIWGEVLTRSDDFRQLTEEKIRDVVEGFRGEISQIPPKYSALKVNGRKLYEYARAGQEVEIKPRKVYIRSIEIDEFLDDGIAFTVECSKGTYVRTICRDIGEALGCGGVMTALERVSSGAFRIEDAVSMDRIKEMTEDELAEIMYSPDYPLVHFGKITLSDTAGRAFANGTRIPVRDGRLYVSEKKRSFIPPEKRTDEREYRYVRKEREDMASSIDLPSGHDEMYNIYCRGEFLGVGKIRDGFLKSDKVFNVRMQNEII